MKANIFLGVQQNTHKSFIKYNSENITLRLNNNNYIHKWRCKKRIHSIFKDKETVKYYNTYFNF